MNEHQATPGGSRGAQGDLLIRHAYVITMDDLNTIIPDGAIAINGRRIVGVGDDKTIASRHQAARTIDAKGAPVHPGLVECHLHASFQTYRGVLPDAIVPLTEQPATVCANGTMG